MNQLFSLGRVPTEILFKICENFDLITLIEIGKIKILKEISKDIRNKKFKNLKKIIESKIKPRFINLNYVYDTRMRCLTNDVYMTVKIENIYVYYCIDYEHRSINGVTTRRIIQLNRF